MEQNLDLNLVMRIKRLRFELSMVDGREEVSKIGYEEGTTLGFELHLSKC